MKGSKMKNIIPQSAPAHVQQLQQALAVKNELHQQAQFNRDNDPVSSKTKKQFKPYETALIRRKEVERLTALSRSRIYALMAAGDFPKPVQLGAMSVAWLEIEVHEWIASRIADRKAA